MGVAAGGREHRLRTLVETGSGRDGSAGAGPGAGLSGLGPFEAVASVGLLHIPNRGSGGSGMISW
jgi:hypothetical protein